MALLGLGRLSSAPRKRASGASPGTAQIANQPALHLHETLRRWRVWHRFQTSGTFSGKIFWDSRQFLAPSKTGGSENECSGSTSLAFQYCTGSANSVVCCIDDYSVARIQEAPRE